MPRTSSSPRESLPASLRTLNRAGEEVPNGNCTSLGPQIAELCSDTRRAKGTLTGNLYVDPTATVMLNNFHVGGEILVENLSPAVTQVQEAATLAAALFPNQTFSGNNLGGMTINLNGVTNIEGGRNTVVQVNGNFGLI